MTLEINGSIWCIGHCYLLSKSYFSNENDRYKSTYWMNLKPVYCSEKISKKAKIDHRLYLMEEINANCFKKLYDKAG